MTAQPGKATAIKAWMKSLPLALALPPVGAVLYRAISSPRWLVKLTSSDVSGELIVLGISVAVHFVAYAVTGLPIFLRRFGQPHSPVWIPRVGIPLGALLGAFMTGGVLNIVLGDGPSLELYLYLLGAGYGTATAIAALLQRPTIKPNENAHHLP